MNFELILIDTSVYKCFSGYRTFCPADNEPEQENSLRIRLKLILRKKT